jgi:DNA-directed RNA polymerase subunit alpha
MQGNARDFLKPKLVESRKTGTIEFRLILEPL